MAYNEIRTINNIQLEDIKARQSIQELDNKKANKSDLVNGLNFKGTTTYGALPTSDNNVGDFYYVTDGDGTNGAGNYAWNGTAWYFSGKTTDFGDISTKANAAVNNAVFEEGKLKVTKNDGTSTETEVVDSSLTVSGKAADAKITGDNIGQLKEDLTELITGTSNLNEIRFSQFEIKKNAEHSSTKDKIYGNFKSGDIIEYLVKSEQVTTKIEAALYVNGSFVSGTTINADVVSIKLNEDTDSLGVYISPAPTDAKLIFVVRRNNNADTIAKLDKRTDGIESTIICDEVVQGSWDKDGPHMDNLRLRSKNVHKVKRGDVLSALTNGLYIFVTLWDKTPSALSDAIVLKKLGWIGDDFTFKCDYDGYISFDVANAKSYNESKTIRPSDYTCKVAINKDVFNTNDFRTVSVLNSEIVQGNWEATGIANDSKRICSKTPYTVKKGDYVFVNPKNKYIDIVIWDKIPFSTVTANVLHDSNWIGGAPFIFSVENDGFLTVKFANSSNYESSTSISPKDYDCDVELFVGNTLNKEVLRSIFNSLEDLKSDVTLLPDYWLDYIKTKMGDITTKTSECALTGDSFIFFTDYHIEQNSGFSHLLMKEIVDKTTINDVVFGGDIYNGTATKNETMDKLRTFIERFSPLSILGTRGNHEYNWNDGGSESVELTESEIYNGLLKKAENSVITNGALSFYKDNANRKIRYLYVDAHYEQDTNNERSIIQQEELNWIKERMTELPIDWTVVVITHNIYTMSYENRDNPIYSSNGERIVNAVNEAKLTMNAKIACIICGHTHYDYSNTNNGYPIITVTCDSRQDSGQWIGWNAGQGTVKEHAFDIFCINTKTKHIETIRIGRGVDRNWYY